MSGAALSLANPEDWGGFADPAQVPVPPRIVAGEWLDPFPAGPFGPRRHPYGLGAYTVALRDGRTLIFPSQADAAAWIAEHGL